MTCHCTYCGLLNLRLGRRTLISAFRRCRPGSIPSGITRHHPTARVRTSNSFDDRRCKYQVSGLRRTKPFACTILFTPQVIQKSALKAVPEPGLGAAFGTPALAHTRRSRLASQTQETHDFMFRLRALEASQCSPSHTRSLHPFWFKCLIRTGEGRLSRRLGLLVHAHTSLPRATQDFFMVEPAVMKN